MSSKLQWVLFSKTQNHDYESQFYDNQRLADKAIAFYKNQDPKLFADLHTKLVRVTVETPNDEEIAEKMAEEKATQELFEELQTANDPKKQVSIEA